jgi:curli biogenesis system outer membrane secretion channel CsgG
VFAGILFAAAAALYAPRAALTGPSTRESAPAAETRNVNGQPVGARHVAGAEAARRRRPVQGQSAYQGAPRGAAQDISHELARTDKFIMITRQDLDLLQDEQDLVKSGCQAGTGRNPAR